MPRGAEAASRELPDELAAAPGLVVAGEGWHPGVVGIVASRLVERHGRPVVLIAIDDAGRGRGSGRSVHGFDLLAGLEACAEHLARFGGHRAAAGLELAADRIEALPRGVRRPCPEALGEAPTASRERIDAFVGAESLDLDVAEQLARLAPSARQPAVRLLVPGARVGDVRPMGEGGRHARFSLESGARGRPAASPSTSTAGSSAAAEPRDGRRGEARDQPLERRGRAPGGARGAYPGEVAGGAPRRLRPAPFLPTRSGTSGSRPSWRDR